MYLQPVYGEEPQSTILRPFCFVYTHWLENLPAPKVKNSLKLRNPKVNISTLDLSLSVSIYLYPYTAYLTPALEYLIGILKVNKFKIRFPNLLLLKSSPSSRAQKLWLVTPDPLLSLASTAGPSADPQLYHLTVSTDWSLLSHSTAATPIQVSASQPGIQIIFWAIACERSVITETETPTRWKK